LAAFAGLVFSVLQIEATFRENPDRATLEGKEIIEYRHLELRLKGKQTVPVREIKGSPAVPPPNNVLIFPEAKERKHD
jgi:hypothetical protein